MTTDTHEIPVTDDEAVTATVHHGPSDRWFVCCHGFLSDRTGSYESRCERAVEAGYSAVRFDFRGCGDADGAFVDQTLSDKLADLEAVVDRVDPDSYVLFGSSFGGKVAFHAAPTDDRVEAVVARAPVTDNRSFDEYREAVREDGECRFEDGRRIDRRFFDDLDRYPFDDVAAALAVPVAIVHGRDDESVPLGDSTDATAALETDVLLEAVAGEGHRFSREGERRMRERMFDWLGCVRER